MISLGVLLVASSLPLLTAFGSGIQTAWGTLTSAGEGFSIEVPGDSQATGEAGHYIYGVDNWTFIIKVDPISPAVRELVETGQREPLASFLQKIAQGMIGKATVVASSSEDFAGYPSLLIYLEDEAENLAVQGINRLVLTEHHLYMLIAVGRKEAPRADADRFLDSFRLTKGASVPTTTSTRSPPAPTSSLAARMAGPMLTVARLITEEELNPRIDQVVQNVPAAAALGNRWNSSSEAWQRARTSIASRIGRIFELYENTGELTRLLEAQLASRATGSDADALEEVLNGPAGDAIVRNCAVIEFVSTVMAYDPNGPKAGERAWTDKMRALKTVFDAGAGSAMPKDDGTHKDELSKYLASPAHQFHMGLWSSVVGKATVDLDGAINLMMFDDRDNIAREIEAAIAEAK